MSDIRVLTEDDLSVVNEVFAAFNASRWKLFAIQLLVPKPIIDRIELRNSSKADMCIYEVLSEWIYCVSNPTCEGLILALRSKSVGESRLADELEQKMKITPKTAPDAKPTVQKARSYSGEVSTSRMTMIQSVMGDIVPTESLVPMRSKQDAKPSGMQGPSDSTSESHLDYLHKQLHPQEYREQVLEAQIAELQDAVAKAKDREQAMGTKLTELQQQLDTIIKEKLPLAEIKSPLKIDWKSLKKMPHKMSGNPCSVVLRRKLYIGGGILRVDQDDIISKESTILQYNLDTKEWSGLKEYRLIATGHDPPLIASFSIAIVNDKLVAVGGETRDELNRSIKVHQIGVWDDSAKQWTFPYQPMQIACTSPTVVSYNNWLIVAGGVGNNGDLKRVEVLDTLSNKWYSAPPLPEECHQMTSTVIRDVWYLLGGSACTKKTQSKHQSTKAVYSVYLPVLISSRTSTIDDQSVWNILPNIPLNLSHALSLHGSLLAVGGRDDSYESCSGIYFYKSSTERWVKIGALSKARSYFGCSMLPDGSFMIAGGSDNKGRSNRVYKAKLRVK